LFASDQQGKRCIETGKGSFSMVSRQIACPNCGEIVPASDINIMALMAKCVGCDHVFSISPHSARHDSLDTAPSRPSGITHETGMSGELILKRSWFHVALFGLLFFCIAWDAFLIFWYSIALFGPAKPGGGFDVMMVVFPIGHVAVGVGLTYYVVAGFLNKTKVMVDFESLTVSHGPIPWRGNQSLRREEVKEIELEFAGINTNSYKPSMTVNVHLQDGRQLVLLSSIPDRQAEYIAWQLAETLKTPLVRRSQPQLPQAPAFLRKFLGAGRT
jgi:hypothetical protein